MIIDESFAPEVLNLEKEFTTMQKQIQEETELSSKLKEDKNSLEAEVAKLKDQAQEEMV